MATEGGTQGLTRIVRRLARPFLGFCLRRSLRLREIVEALKAELVDVAEDELRRRGESVSVSRIALMTGVHRKDVTALMRRQAPRSQSESLITRLIGQWRNDRRYSKNGRPRPLVHIGEDSEFAALVRSVNREVNPYSVIFELTRSGIAAEQDGTLKLLQNEYIPIGKLDERFAVVSQDVDDLVRAAEGNILTPSDVPNLHLTTRYDNIVLDELPRIRRWFMQQGAQLHERARRFLSEFDRDINPKLAGKPGGGRVAIGTFSFAEETADEPVGSDRAAGDRN